VHLRVFGFIIKKTKYFIHYSHNLESSHILRNQSVHYHPHNYMPLDFIPHQVNQSTPSILMLSVYLHLLLSSNLHFSDNHNKMFHVFLMSPVYKVYATARFTVLILTATGQLALL